MADNNVPPDPSNYDPRNQEVFNKFAKENAKIAAEITNEARSLTEELKDQLGIRSRLNETERSTLNLARQLQSSASQNSVDIGNAGNIQRQITKDRRIALNIEREINDLKSNLLPEEVKFAKKISETTDKINDLQKEIAESTGKDLEDAKDKLGAYEDILRFSLKDAKSSTQRLALAMSMSKTTAKLIAQRKVESDTQDRITDKMGVTGALVKGTGALMERLGMRSGIFQKAMTDSAETMRDMAEQTERGEASFSKTEIMLKGLSTLSQGFGKALFDPFTIATAILDAFFKVNKAQTEFIQLTGRSAASLGGVNTEVASMTDLLKTAAALTKQTGLNAAAIFTPQQIGQIADATELLGISAEQGVKLGMIMKQTGRSADDIGNAIYRNVDAGISNKVVYDDVLSASDDIVASAGGNVEALGRAASAARKLGLDLSKVNQIADGLLDFEASIESELEAQLLTGKNINLSKARELALNNDLEGVAKELEKNGASAAEFAKMNRIQQQALAKAMGMSREELGKMVLTKEAMANMSDDEIANARGMTLEQSKQMDIQAKIQKSMDRLAQAFAPILEAVVPIVEAFLSIIRPIAAVVGYVLKFKAVSIALTTVLAGIAGFFAVKKIANFVGVGIKGFNAMRSSISEMGTGMKGVKGLFSKAGESIKGSFTKGLGDKAKDLKEKVPDSLKKSGDTVGDLSKKTKDVKADSGAGIRGFLKGLGDGLASIGRQLKDVVKGAIAIGVAGLALGGSFALALKMVENVDPVQMIAFAGAISMFGLTLALLGKIGKDVIKGALALGILGVGLIPAAYAFSLLAGVDAGSMFAFAGALSLLGLAAAGLGFLFPFIALGAGALALLGAALIPAAYGFSLIQGLDMDTILSFAKGVGVLAATTAALGLISPLIMLGSVALAALGLALIPLSYGFAALGETPIESIIGKLQGLAAIAPQLLLVGAGLMGIAAGLGMIAISGIAAIPALAALSAFALVASPLAALGGLFGDGEGEEDNTMAEISSKLDTLISVVSAGGNVYLDGDKVGETQVLGNLKLS